MLKMDTEDINWLVEELIQTKQFPLARAFILGLYAASIDKTEYDRLFGAVNKAFMDDYYRTVMPGWPFGDQVKSCDIKGR